MRIVIVGAGVQGTVFAVRLASARHNVTLVSRGERAVGLRRGGATIQNVDTLEMCTKRLPVFDKLPPDFAADICLVTVRREQIQSVLPDIARAVAIPRVVFLANHPNGSEDLIRCLGRSRAILAFSGIAGVREGNIIRYVDVAQQHTVVEKRAQDVISLLRKAGIPVDGVRDMDAWLQRHAVFITAIVGSLYKCNCDAIRLSQQPEMLRDFIVAVREGWLAQDSDRVGPAPFALRAMMCWMPMPLSTKYWSLLLASPRGDLYFARHARHAPLEMVALADDVRNSLLKGDGPTLRRLLVSIDIWCQKHKSVP